MINGLEIVGKVVIVGSAFVSEHPVVKIVLMVFFYSKFCSGKIRKKSGQIRTESGHTANNCVNISSKYLLSFVC